MPKHDLPTATIDDFRELTEEQAEEVENIAKIMAEHLYAQPDTARNEQSEADDCTLWEFTSEENKRIFRSCALDVWRSMQK